MIMLVRSVALVAMLVLASCGNLKHVLSELAGGDEFGNTAVTQGHFETPGHPIVPQPYNVLLNGKPVWPAPVDQTAVVAFLSDLAATSLAGQQIVVYRQSVDSAAIMHCLSLANQSPPRIEDAFQYIVDGQGGQIERPVSLAALVDGLRVNQPWDFATFFIFQNELDVGFPQPEQPTFDCLKTLGGFDL